MTPNMSEKMMKFLNLPKISQDNPEYIEDSFWNFVFYLSNNNFHNDISSSIIKMRLKINTCYKDGSNDTILVEIVEI